MDNQQFSDWATRLLLNNPFPGKSQRDLVEIIKACRIQRFKEGQHILKEGEKGDDLYFLMEGEVVVLKRDTNGEERELVVMTSPTLFGHMALVDGSPRSASCKAKGVVTLAVMSRQLYNEMLSRPHPIGTNLRRLMLATLTRQLVNGNKRLFGLMGGDLPEESAAKKPVVSSKAQAAPARKRRPAQDSKKDVSRQDLLEMAGILNGWKVDATGLEDVEFVETEAGRRRSGKTSI
jgi:CRP-like cAMP-binding protein